MRPFSADGPILTLACTLPVPLAVLAILWTFTMMLFFREGGSHRCQLAHLSCNGCACSFEGIAEDVAQVLRIEGLEALCASQSPWLDAECGCALELGCHCQSLSLATAVMLAFLSSYLCDACDR